MKSDEARRKSDTLRQRIRSEGALAGYEALLAVCRDPRAPAPAKATAGTALMRAAGLLEKTSDPSEKEPHEMTAAELADAIARAEAGQAFG